MNLVIPRSWKSVILGAFSGTLVFFALRASADPPATRKEEIEFQQWLIQRAEILPLRPFEVNMINITLQDKPIKVRLFGLSDIIGRDDFMLSKYVGLMEENQRKYGLINPFDRQLLTTLRRFDIPAKRARLERFDKVTHALGIDDPPFNPGGWKDALPSAPAKGDGKRYNPESGLYEETPKP
jgi:hypothetical protein